MHRKAAFSLREKFERRRRRSLLAGDGRVGAYARRELRRRQTEWIRTRLLLVALFLLVAGAMCVAVHFVLPATIAPYLIGALVASVLWWIHQLMTESAGLTRWRTGTEAERRTADVLRRYTRHGWYVVNHVLIDRTDVDHALLGPGGFFAVETKFRSEWGTVRDLNHLANGAWRGASDLHARIGIKGPPVTPVLVAWGPDAEDRFPEPSVHGGVVLCAGAQLRRYVDDLPTCHGHAEVQAAFEKLEDYVRRRDGRELSDAGPLPVTAEEAIQRALFTAGSAIATTCLVLAPFGLPPTGLWSALSALALCASAFTARRLWSASVRVRLGSTASIACAAFLGVLVASALVITHL